MICKKCKNELKEGAKFCTICGCSSLPGFKWMKVVGILGLIGQIFGVFGTLSTLIQGGADYTEIGLKYIPGLIYMGLLLNIYGLYYFTLSILYCDNPQKAFIVKIHSLIIMCCSFILNVIVVVSLELYGPIGLMSPIVSLFLPALILVSAIQNEKVFKGQHLNNTTLQ